jgi:hypothetical protein
MAEKINEEDREFLLKLCMDIIRGADITEDVEPIDCYVADTIIKYIEEIEEE